MADDGTLVADKDGRLELPDKDLPEERALVELGRVLSLLRHLRPQKLALLNAGSPARLPARPAPAGAAG